MPRSSKWPRTAPETVLVIDTCSLIKMKNPDLLKMEEQFLFFSELTPMLQRGELAFPRQVVHEFSRAQWPDTPGAWATGCKSFVQYPDPSDAALAEALGAAQLIDSQNDKDEADPYIIGMAIEIVDHYTNAQVIVVSDDVKDRMPRKESVLTACKRLDFECWQAVAFVDHVRARASGSG